MALSNNDLQAIAALIQEAVAPLQKDITDIKTEMHDNNEFLLSEMERLHDIQSRKIDDLSEKVDSIRDNKEMTDFLLQQLSDLKKRMDKLENKIA